MTPAGHGSQQSTTSLLPCRGRGDDAPPPRSASRTDGFSSDPSPTSPFTSPPSPSPLLSRVRISHRQPWQPRLCHRPSAATTLAAPWAWVTLWGLWVSSATRRWVNSWDNNRRRPTQVSCLSSTSIPSIRWGSTRFLVVALLDAKEIWDPYFSLIRWRRASLQCSQELLSDHSRFVSPLLTNSNTKLSRSNYILLFSTLANTI